MTKLTYDQSGNVRTLQFITAFQFGSYSDQSHTGFDVTDGVGGQATDHLTGYGHYSARLGIPTEGTITAMSGDFGGAAYFEMSGLDLSVSTPMHELDLHNRAKLANDFFGGADQEVGSNDSDALYGYGGDDTLSGKGGGDDLAAGAGQDLLTGGGG